MFIMPVLQVRILGLREINEILKVKKRVKQQEKNGIPLYMRIYS